LATKTTTVGKILLGKALPPDTRFILDQGPLDKDRIFVLMSHVAKQYPEKYREILQKLHEYGEDAATYYGGQASLTSRSFFAPPEVLALRDRVRSLVETIRSNPHMSEDAKRKAIVKALKDYKEKAKDLLLKQEDNSFVLQVKSGSRGSPDNLANILVGSFVASGPSGEEIDTPILHGYAEGLTPAEYWTTGYGARLGYYGTKFSTPVAGDIANQLALAAQRLRVTEKDCGTHNGIPVSTSDSDYEGAVLAADYGDIAKKGDILTPELMRKLARKYDEVLIRSPITCEAEYGVCQKCAGKLPEFPELGDFIGVTAVQALSEPLSQSQISAKHSGKKIIGGIDLVKALISVPSNMAGEASIAEKTGVVREITTTPAGGSKIVVGNKEYYLEPGTLPIVKEGQVVERGDILSTGIPNPAKLARYRGVGDARYKFVKIFSDALKDANIGHNKRNIEFLSRALINHARITQPYAGFLPGDIVEYPAIERRYEPRQDARQIPARKAVGYYLGKPVGYYTISTKLTDSMAKRLESIGMKEVLAHPEPPPFEPVMRRAMESMSHSEDWLDRLGGYYAKNSILDALYSGTTSTDPTKPTAVIPSLVLRGRIPQIDG